MCIGNLKFLKHKLPTALEKFAYEITKSDSSNQLGAVCTVIPYVKFTDKIRLYRMFVCHTPAGCDGKKACLHPETVVTIAQVVLKPNTSCAEKLKFQACAEGLVYSPTWHCGHSEELQACFTDRKLLPELVPVLQQLELDTTMEVKRKLCEALTMH